MKLINGVCLGQNRAEIGGLFVFLKEQKDNIHRTLWICYHHEKY